MCFELYQVQFPSLDFGTTYFYPRVKHGNSRKVRTLLECVHSILCKVGDHACMLRVDYTRVSVQHRDRLIFRIFIANGTESIFFMSISNMLLLSGGSLWQFLCASYTLLQVPQQPLIRILSHSNNRKMSRQQEENRNCAQEEHNFH